MPAITKITIQHGDEAAATIADRLGEPAARKSEALQKLVRFLAGVAGHVHRAKLTLRIENASTTAKATGAIGPIVNASVSNGDTVTIGGRVLTVAASPANENEFASGASAALTGASLIACINANSELKGLVTATGGATVTLTYVEPGRVGNLVTLASSDGTAFPVSGARFTTGASTELVAAREYDFL